MGNRIKLAIEEEYGYRHWVAYLDKLEYDDLLQRWASMRGLDYMVPVRLIIPQAVPAFGLTDINIHELRRQRVKYCAINLSDDSYLSGAVAGIPEADAFQMDGKTYTEAELIELRRLDSEVYAAAWEAWRSQYPGASPF